MAKLTMEDILNSKLGDDCEGEIRVIFQKKTAIKQYEPEMIELESTLRMGKGVTGAERMLAAATVLTQLEYTGFVQLLATRQITQAEFDSRRAQLLYGMEAIKNKYVALTGKDTSEYF